MKEIEKTRITSIVKNLISSYKEMNDSILFDNEYHLNRSVIIESIEKLRQLLFPGYFGKKNIAPYFVEYHTGELIEELCFELSKQVEYALRHRQECGSCSDCEGDAKEIVLVFLERLTNIRRLLATDVQATFDGDPAAASKDEIISSYPGIYAIMVYRLAHELFLLKVPMIPRIMTEHAHSATGIDINPGAHIGHHFFIDHGTGIVIGETTVIGNNVKIYQGVTLGALSTKDGQALKSVKRHPTIEDNVTVYAGASILGGGTVIGEGVIIGSNAFITGPVPKNTRVNAQGNFRPLELPWDYQI
ncbi:MAG: serine O-acetyltransferase [Spirochaetaceae bacterium]|jgi:serine O-acetyltransferase|nr:serine O-acetyltransferase [Spirochaetaceae bacterium]GMO20816.1 MAG: serine acetyltransferase [Termitinemataceae bacterium]